jgi:hypothetical protein
MTDRTKNVLWRLAKLDSRVLNESSDRHQFREWEELCVALLREKETYRTIDPPDRRRIKKNSRIHFERTWKVLSNLGFVEDVYFQFHKKSLRAKVYRYDQALADSVQQL